MRRSLVAIAVAALAGSTLAFAPAVTSQQAEPQTDHVVIFTEDGTETVDGTTDAVGTHLVSSECTKDPDTYCETVHVTVEQPVADENPDEPELGTGTVTFALAPTLQGADFDVTVWETNADGTDRGTEAASSGNFPACATLCGTPAGAVIGEGCGAEHDECGAWGVSTSELGGTRFYLVEVVYYAAGGGYTLDLAYERTDGRTADGTTGSPDEPAPEPAASAERVDLTGGFEPAGDWGGGGDAAALGDALGQDLTAAYLEYGEDTFTFTIEVANLPAAGGMPEATRYTWDFNYDGAAFQLDGKFTNYSRGACDPTAGNCPPPRDPGVGFFALRGNCVTEGNVTTCQELGSTHATFDAEAGTITIPVPAPLLAADGVAACDTIAGGSLVAQPSAFFSLSTGPQDAAAPWVPFTVPHADPDLSCG